MRCEVNRRNGNENENISSNQTILLKDIIKYSNKKGSSEALLFMGFWVSCKASENEQKSYNKVVLSK